MLDNGATTSWEGWTGQSHIHDTLIIDRRMVYRRPGGNPERWEVARISSTSSSSPPPVGDLTFAKAKYQSIHGDIVSDWRIEGGTFKLSVTVPPGTTATVYIPGEGAIKTQAKPTSSTEGNVKRGFDVGPGTHSFEAALR